MVSDYSPHKAIFDELKETYKKIEKASDKSSFEEQYALTTTGEPIALPEYTCRITKGENTHTVLLFDWDPTKRNQIKKEHVNEKAQFQELVLDSRPGQ